MGGLLPLGLNIKNDRVCALAARALPTGLRAA